MTLREFFLTEMKAQGLSYRQAARRVGIPFGQLHRVLNDTAPLTTDHVRHILHGLRLHLDMGNLLVPGIGVAAVPPACEEPLSVVGY